MPADDLVLAGTKASAWWRHQMETFSALLAICAVPGESPHKGQWRRALMFSLICIWINSWVNNREAGDLRCYRAHYDVTVTADTTVLIDIGIDKWHSGLTHYASLSHHMASKSWVIIGSNNGLFTSLFDAKSLPETKLTYCKLHSQEQTSMKFSIKWNTISWKCIWVKCICCLQKDNHLVQVPVSGLVMPYGIIELCQHWFR